MAAKKRTKKSKNQKASSVVPMPLRRIGVFLSGPGRSFALELLAVGILVGACIVLWREVKTDLLAGKDYQVTAADIEITPLPNWIRTDPREKAYEYMVLRGPLSIMDDNATERVAEAFLMHPWVERVIRVTKHHPARIRVELKYRRPVCMVRCVMQGKEGLLPVDQSGIWLPGDGFNEIEANRYPLVVGIKSAPVGLPGMPWRDKRVVGAAGIAAALGESWYKLGLHRIATAGRVSAGRRSEYSYDLYTQGNRRISWGCSPQAKIAGEPSAKEKIERLLQFASIHGGLDNGPSDQPIDVRRLSATRKHVPMAAAPGTLDQR